MNKRRVVLISTIKVNDPASPELFMPLSIMALGSVLAKEGFEPLLIDVQVDDDWREALSESLKDALFLGVSCYTGPSIHGVLEAIEISRKVDPHVPIVWGGYHATLAHQSILKEDLVDYVALGSGEETVVGLARLFSESTDSAAQERDLAKIPNLAYSRRGEPVYTPRQLMGDMNELPPMNYELIDVDKYDTVDHRRLQYTTSYGCPYGCTFCVEPGQSGRRWRPLSAQRVVDEVESLADRYAIDRVNFMDPNMSSDAKRVVAIAKELERRGLYIENSCDMRAEDVVRIAKKIDMDLLRAVGFVEVFLGLESGSDRMLKAMNKDATAAASLEACRLLDGAGIQQDSSFLHDIPGETAEDSDLTFALAEELCSLEHNRQLHHWFMPYPGTELFNIMRADARLDRDGTQSDWAESSTYWGSDLWSGGSLKRRQLLRRLLKLKETYPSTFMPPSTLPVLRHIDLTPATGSGGPDRIGPESEGLSAPHASPGVEGGG